MSNAVIVHSYNAQSYSTNEVERTNNPSFFIPRIDFQFTKTNIKDIFEKVTDAVVTRVDFVSFNSEKGVGRRAYVHFEKWTPQIKQMYSTIEMNGRVETSVNSPDGSSQPHILNILINTNPVPETTLNLNQLASNVEFLADQVKNQQELIDSQQNIIENQQRMLCMMEQRINQLSMCVMPMPHLAMPPPPPLYLIPNNGMNVQHLPIPPPPAPPALYRKM